MVEYTQSREDFMWGKSQGNKSSGTCHCKLGERSMKELQIAVDCQSVHPHGDGDTGQVMMVSTRSHKDLLKPSHREMSVTARQRGQLTLPGSKEHEQQQICVGCT